MAKQAVEEDAGRDLACYGQKGDSTVVVAGLAVSLALVNVDYCGVPEFLLQLLLVPHGLVQSCQMISDGCTTGLVNLSRVTSPLDHVQLAQVTNMFYGI